MKCQAARLLQLALAVRAKDSADRPNYSLDADWAMEVCHECPVQSPMKSRGNEQCPKVAFFLCAEWETGSQPSSYPIDISITQDDNQQVRPCPPWEAVPLRPTLSRCTYLCGPFLHVFNAFNHQHHLASVSSAGCLLAMQPRQNVHVYGHDHGGMSFQAELELMHPWGLPKDFQSVMLAICSTLMPHDLKGNPIPCSLASVTVGALNMHIGSQGQHCLRKICLGPFLHGFHPQYISLLHRSSSIKQCRKTITRWMPL